MFRKFVIPYVPPVIAAAVMGTLAFNELEQHAPTQLREKMQELRPYILLGKKTTVSTPEFSGDATPQRGVFVGNDRNYTCVLVLNSSPGNNSSLQERKSLTRNVAKACVEWEPKDVDIAMGLGPKVWDAIKGNVRLGNLANAAAMQKSNLITNSGGDVIVHIKADSQTACAEVVESVLHACRHNNVNWSEDVYGYAPPVVVPTGGQKPKVCPATLHLDPADNCKIACTPNVGSSFVLFQKWEDVRKKQVVDAAAAADNKPPSNHKSRVYGLDENDQPLRILKNTWRTGKLGTKTAEDKLGMVFVAYSVNPKIFEYMLERMAGKRGGVEDTTLQTHKLVRSQLFFVPSRAQVRDLAM